MNVNKLFKFQHKSTTAIILLIMLHTQIGCLSLCIPRIVQREVQGKYEQSYLLDCKQAGPENFGPRTCTQSIRAAWQGRALSISQVSTSNLLNTHKYIKNQIYLLNYILYYYYCIMTKQYFTLPLHADPCRLLKLGANRVVRRSRR